MKISDLKANNDLVPLWPDEDCWMRPMTKAQAKRLQRASQRQERFTAYANDVEDEEEAAALREQAESAEREMGAILFEELVVDHKGQPLEGDMDDVSPTLVVRIWARVREVHEEMGKRPSNRKSRSGSAPAASTRTASG